MRGYTVSSNRVVPPRRSSTGMATQRKQKETMKRNEQRETTDRLARLLKFLQLKVENEESNASTWH